MRWRITFTGREREEEVDVSFEEIELLSRDIDSCIKLHFCIFFKYV